MKCSHVVAVLAGLGVLAAGASRAEAGYLVVNGKRVEVPFHVVHAFYNFADVRPDKEEELARTPPDPKEEPEEHRMWVQGLDMFGERLGRPVVMPRGCTGKLPPFEPGELKGDVVRLRKLYAAWKKKHAAWSSKCSSRSPVEDVRLVMLHSTITRTAWRAVEGLKNRDLSTHLIVDWDGTVYQVMDLAKMALHGGAEVNPVSIGVDLVMLLVNLSRPAGDMAKRLKPFQKKLAAYGEKPPIGSARYHGLKKVFKSPGPTPAQMKATAALCGALVKIFPNLKGRVPDDVKSKGKTRSYSVIKDLKGYSGILGHWHASPQRWDPGPAVDWKMIERAVKAK